MHACKHIHVCVYVAVAHTLVTLRLRTCILGFPETQLVILFIITYLTNEKLQVIIQTYGMLCNIYVCRYVWVYNGIQKR